MKNIRSKDVPHYLIIKEVVNNRRLPVDYDIEYDVAFTAEEVYEKYKYAGCVIRSFRAFAIARGLEITNAELKAKYMEEKEAEDRKLFESLKERFEGK